MEGIYIVVWMMDVCPVDVSVVIEALNLLRGQISRVSPTYNTGTVVSITPVLF